MESPSSFLGGHGSHYGADLFNVVASNFIQPFILKAGYRKNDQMDDNSPNDSLKAVYNKKNVSGYKGLQLQNLHHHI